MENELKKSEDKSLISEANLKIQRMSNLQEGINALSVHPRDYDPDFKEYNYSGIFRALTQLFVEIYPKLTTPEKQEFINLKNKIQNHLKNNPPYKEFPGHFGKKTISFYKIPWENLREMLFKYDLLSRGFLEKYFNTAEKIKKTLEA